MLLGIALSFVTLVVVALIVVSSRATAALPETRRRVAPNRHPWTWHGWVAPATTTDGGDTVGVVRGRGRRGLIAFTALLPALVVVSVLTGYFYAKDLEINPPGFFSDEAEIGWEAAGVTTGRTEFTFGPFYYQHFGQRFLGAWPVLATAPFVDLLGMTDEAVRLSGVFWIAVTAMLIILALRRLETPYPLVPLIVMLGSPVIIHLSRANFGLPHTLALMALCTLLWIVGRQTGRLVIAFGAGLVAGIAVYGQASFMAAIPLFLLFISLTEIAFNRRDWRAYRPVLALAGGSLLAALPAIYVALTREEFWTRLREKRGVGYGEGVSLADRFEYVRRYYSLDYLVRFGEQGGIDRHSVPGAGLISGIAILAIVAGLAGLGFWRRDPIKRYVLPFAALAVVYPLPDIFSKSPDPVPYTVSVYWAVVTIPFLAGYGMRYIAHLARSRSVAWLTGVVAGITVLFALTSAFSFYNGDYARYPATAADYWGWQFGPKPAIAYFLDHQNEYDRFLLDPDFNGAYVFLDFYIDDEEAHRKAAIGSIDRVVYGQIQLAAVRTENLDRFEPLTSRWGVNMRSVRTIRYPDGSPAITLMRVDTSQWKSLLLDDPR